jgi:hypothetical protein
MKKICIILCFMFLNINAFAYDIAEEKIMNNVYDSTNEALKITEIGGTWTTFTDGDTSPSVLIGKRFLTANTAPTSITTFDGGTGTLTTGKEIIVNFTDAITTLVNGVTLHLQGGVNYTAAIGDVIKLIYRSGVWYEEGRAGSGGVESDTLATVTGRGANTTVSSSFQNASAIVLGKDEAGGTPNIAGSTKMFSAGDNAYYTTITAGTNTSNFSITLPVDEPLGTYLLSMTSGGVMGYNASVYLTAEADTLQTVTTRGATTTTNIASTNVLAFTAGEDVAGGTTNIPGQIKLWSNGDNAYYNTFTSGTNTANATYTLPTAMPGANAILQSTNSGILTWEAAAPASAHNFLSTIHGDTVAGNAATGDIVFANNTPAWTKLAGNTNTYPKILKQTGDGTFSVAPTWSIISEDKDFCINDPSSIASTRIFFHVDAEKYPNGIKLTNVQITLPAAVASTGYQIIYKEYSNANPPALVSTIEAVSADATSTFVEVTGASIDDSDIASDGYIILDIPATASDEVNGKIMFYAK